ncbi:hypothetical protein LB521_27935 [Mesorhizobium sp. BR-1-1-8]|uniref:hypothetical protein n=1 Tax=unclassified Mesorhizobium TaxID=325217 RepID=UPI001CCEEF12|nr:MULTISPECIES: hypothetical protein [unclassified Mesorhizobium]MBZ9973475.1 hypothetical protein [Mesorhizobium sp. BR1-1-12]MBZ9984969.1 hypothetical protein [Mesorhizobium sp. BR-1-1-8]
MTYHDEHDPELHDNDEPHTPSPLTQSLMGAAIMLVIGLAFYGLTEIMQHALAGIQ